MEPGQKIQLIPLDFDAWDAMTHVAPQQDLTAVDPHAAAGKDAAGKGAAAGTGKGKGEAGNFQERLQQRIDLNFQEQQQRIDDLEHTLTEQSNEHELVIGQHAEQIQALENQVYTLQWKYDEIWQKYEDMMQNLKYQ